MLKNKAWQFFMIGWEAAAKMAFITKNRGQNISKRLFGPWTSWQLLWIISCRRKGFMTTGPAVTRWQPVAPQAFSYLPFHLLKDWLKSLLSNTSTVSFAGNAGSFWGGFPVGTCCKNLRYLEFFGKNRWVLALSFGFSLSFCLEFKKLLGFGENT